MDHVALELGGPGERAGRRTLHTGADLLTDKQTTRLRARFEARVWRRHEAAIAGH